jgi:ribosomal protein L29
MLTAIREIMDPVRDQIVTGKGTTLADESTGRMTDQQLQEWLQSLSERLFNSRHERHSDIFWRAMFSMLKTREYKHSMARLADVWIICGMRYPQTRKTLAADFFPTADQIASVNHDYVSASEMRDAVKAAYQRGYASGRMVERERHEISPDSLELVRQIVELKTQITNLQEDLAAARGEATT